MTLTNAQIVALINSGILASTSHTLPVAHNYKVYSFKKSLKKAFEEYTQKEEDLLKECGIENPQEFNSKLHAFSIAENLSVDEQGEFNTMKEIVNNYNKLHAELNKDEVEVPCKTIDYESWVLLQRENNHKDLGGREVDIFSGEVEELLEDKFWLAPVEE